MFSIGIQEFIVIESLVFLASIILGWVLYKYRNQHSNKNKHNRNGNRSGINPLDSSATRIHAMQSIPNAEQNSKRDKRSKQKKTNNVPFIHFR